MSFSKNQIPALTNVAQLVGVILQTERLPVQFLVRAHAWVAGLVPGRGVGRRQLFGVSLSHRCFSPSLPLFLESIKKHLTPNSCNTKLQRCSLCGVHVKPSGIGSDLGERWFAVVLLCALLQRFGQCINGSPCPSVLKTGRYSVLYTRVDTGHQFLQWILARWFSNCNRGLSLHAQLANVKPTGVVLIKSVHSVYKC